MLNLREISIGIAVVDQRVQILRCFPNAFLASLQTEILLLFSEDIIDRLVLMIESVELCHARIRLRVILPELGFRLPFLVSTLDEVIPLVDVGKRVRGSWNSCAHTGPPAGLI